MNNIRRRFFFVLSAILFATSPIAILAADTSGSHHHDGGGSSELHKVMMDGMQEMQSIEMSGDVDKDFAAMMIHHHEQAIAMAKVVQARGKNAELKAMARKMSEQQTKEIAELKRFAK